MSPTALALVLVAAVFHAGWNLLAKRARDPIVFLFWSISLASILLSPAIALALAEDRFDLRAWPFLLATCSVHAVYLYALGRAYQHGEFSVVYPIARGLGVALVAVFAWLTLDERLSALGITGIVLVVTGMIAINLLANRGKLTGGAGTGWALLTGLCVGIYSTVDKAGVAYLDPFTYVSVLGLGQAAFVSPVIFARRRALILEWQHNRKAILVSTSMSLTAYLFVLYAFQISKAGYVVAGREVSIVFSAFIGVLILGEGRLRPRLLGAVLIVTGVFCVALAR